MQLEHEVELHADKIRELADTSRSLATAQPGLSSAAGDPEAIIKRQAHIDKLYAELRSLAAERRTRLEETVKLFVMHRDIDDLEQWIADKSLVADSNELGADAEHVALLQERFAQFATDTQLVGHERVAHVTQLANVLIDSGHADSAAIGQWSEALNAAWEDLLELIRTRTQMLDASARLQQFFSECRQLIASMHEKSACMPGDEECGRDAQSCAQLQRRHATFEENELSTLGTKCLELRSQAASLADLYAGDKAQEIREREAELVREWAELQRFVAHRRVTLADTGDLHKLFCLSRDLMMWMESQQRAMRNEDKPRDVSGVELLLNNHKSLRAEIDARAETFTICLNLGKSLIGRAGMRQRRAGECKERCVQLCVLRDRVADQWQERWSLLQLMLEVYQFARDAAVAEQWLVAQEPYLLNEDLGDTLDQVEQLIKKHETVEKSILAQEERFNALRKLTTHELRQNRRSAVSTTSPAAAAAAATTSAG